MDGKTVVISAARCPPQEGAGRQPLQRRQSETVRQDEDEVVRLTDQVHHSRRVGAGPDIRAVELTDRAGHVDEARRALPRPYEFFF